MLGHSDLVLISKKHEASPLAGFADALIGSLQSSFIHMRGAYHQAETGLPADQSLCPTVPQRPTETSAQACAS